MHRNMRTGRVARGAPRARAGRRGARLVAFLAALVAGTAAAARGQTAPRDAARPVIVRIHYETYAGMCVGYCLSSVTVEGGRVVAIDSAWSDKATHPTVRIEGRIPRQEWLDLQHAIDREALLALPNSIGCPGCVDDPVEAIEVTFSDGTTKSVAYSAGGPPPSLANVARELGRVLEKVHRLTGR